MKLKMNLEFIVDVGEYDFVDPLDEIEENFKHDQEVIDVLSCGLPFYDFKVKATKVE